jgi:hypothetical protein
MMAQDKLLLEAFLTIAAASFALGFWIRRKERASCTWPHASGRIVTCETVRQSVSGREYATPVIAYEFNYEGRLFKSSHWRFGNFSAGSVESTEAVISRYPIGAPVTVFVNTRQPMKSVLEHQPSSLCWVPFGFGIFFLALLILALFIFILKLQR